MVLLERKNFFFWYMGWMAENIVKRVFFCFCLFFFFFVVLFLHNKCKWWKKYRITKSQPQMGYMVKLRPLLVTKIFRWCLLPKWKILYSELQDCFQLFLYKVKSHVYYFPKYFTKFMYLINVLFFFKSG